MRGKNYTDKLLEVISVQSINRRTKEVKRRLVEAEAALNKLQKRHPTHTIEYLETQWKRQKEIQKKVISESAKDKRKQIAVLLALEEELVESRYVSF